MRTLVKVLGCGELNWFYAIRLNDKCVQQYQQYTLYRYIQFTIKH